MRIRFDRPRYLLHVARKKLIQFPDVLSEINPKIILDETCRPPRGNVYAIVVKYVNFGLSEDFLALLECLAAQSIDAVVVCNGTPTEAMLEQLRARTYRILVRRNVGRDMGAYRAATLHLHAQGLKASRVLYLNDSVIYLPGPDLDAFVRGMVDTSYDIVGAAENHEFQHHLGSYALSMTGQAFCDEKVLAFWRSYRPYDIRPHAIRKGEIKWNRVLKRRGYKFDVLYGADDLWEQLQAMSFPQLVDLLRFMPGDFQTKALTPALGSLAELAALFEPPPGAGGHSPSIPRVLLSGRQCGPEHALIKSALIDQILRAITQRSQVHYGFGLLHRLLGCPLVKKDLLQRGIYLEQQMMEILDGLPAGRRAGVMRELINRGRPSFRTPRDRFLDRHGLL